MTWLHRHKWGPWEPVLWTDPTVPDAWYPTRDPFKRQRTCQGCGRVQQAGYGGA